MATVKAFQIKGLKLWFWSNDHEPPHFHAQKSGGWEVKVSFMLDPVEMIEVKWGEKAISTRMLRDICSLAEKHREKILEQWEEIQNV